MNSKIFPKFFSFFINDVTSSEGIWVYWEVITFLLLSFFFLGLESCLKLLFKISEDKTTNLLYHLVLLEVFCCNGFLNRDICLVTISPLLFFITYVLQLKKTPFKAHLRILFTHGFTEMQNILEERIFVHIYRWRQMYVLPK